MKKIILSTLLAALMLVQAVPMTVLAADTATPTANDSIKDEIKEAVGTLTNIAGVSKTERTNKNGSKTIVFSFDGKSIEITNYEGIQVITEIQKDKLPNITVIIDKNLNNPMIEVPVDLGGYFKTNWVDANYYDKTQEYLFAKYDSDNKILSFQMKKTGSISIIDDYTFEKPEDGKKPEGEDKVEDGSFTTKRENKNGSVTNIVVTGGKVTEITSYEKFQVILVNETGKAPVISVSFNEGKRPAKMMIEVPINMGYNSRAGWVDATYADGKQEYIFAKYDNTNNILSFELTKDAKIEIVGNFTPEKPVRPETPVEKKFPFTDVNNTDWYYDAVKYVYDNEIMVGVSDVKFAPNETITRAMVVTMLHRMEGKPITKNTITFKDVESDKWYTEAIRWAANAKIVSGYNSEEFGTNDAITREQMLTILYRYAQYKKVDVKLDKDADKMAFIDGNKVGDWARPAAEWAYANGIISGYNSYLMPQDNATRAMAAAMIEVFNTEIVK